MKINICEILGLNILYFNVTYYTSIDNLFYSFVYAICYFLVVTFFYSVIQKTDDGADWLSEIIDRMKFREFCMPSKKFLKLVRRKWGKNLNI